MTSLLQMGRGATGDGAASAHSSPSQYPWGELAARVEAACAELHRAHLIERQCYELYWRAKDAQQLAEMGELLLEAQQAWQIAHQEFKESTKACSRVLWENRAPSGALTARPIAKPRRTSALNLYGYRHSLDYAAATNS